MEGNASVGGVAFSQEHRTVLSDNHKFVVRVLRKIGNYTEIALGKENFFREMPHTSHDLGTL